MNTRQKSGWVRGICSAWSRKLPQAPGGWAESAGPGWTEGPETSRTMLSQARLAYSFTHGGLPGDPELARAGREATERMMKLFWRPALRGWIRSVDRDGKPADMTIDTYDQGFGLLALAWNSRASGRAGSPEARTTALEALQGLDGETSGPGGGYRERRNGDRPSPMVSHPLYRRQNPHMHLLEAFLSWHAEDPSGPWLEHARAMVALLRERFRLTADGPLAEYFEEDWKPAPGEAGRILEPGHQYEWVWLLRRYFEASGDAAAGSDAESLFRFARDRGTDADGFAMAAVDVEGGVLDGGKLLWPQTEMLKAHLAVYEWTGEIAAREAAESTLRAIKTRFMREDGELFYNRLDRGGRPDPAPALSRLLYHLFVAGAEAERLGL